MGLAYRCFDCGAITDNPEQHEKNCPRNYRTGKYRDMYDEDTSYKPYPGTPELKKSLGSSGGFVPDNEKRAKSLAKQYEDAVYRGDLEEMVKINDYPWKNGDMRLGNDGLEIYKDGKFEKAPSKEDKIIKLLEEILERMPPKPSSGEMPGHGFCEYVSLRADEQVRRCIKTPNHRGEHEFFD